MGPPTEGPLNRWGPHCTLHPTPNPCVPSNPTGTRGQRPGASLPRTGICPHTQAFPSPEPPAGVSPPRPLQGGGQGLVHPSILHPGTPHTPAYKGSFLLRETARGPGPVKASKTPSLPSWTVPGPMAAQRGAFPHQSLMTQDASWVTTWRGRPRGARMERGSPPSGAWWTLASGPGPQGSPERVTRGRCSGLVGSRSSCGWERARAVI